MMHGHEKSDLVIVAVKPTNKAEQSAVEPAEPRAETKENASQQSTCRAQDRISVTQALERVRKVAKERKRERFTSLLHHISPELLGEPTLRCATKATRTFAPDGGLAGLAAGGRVSVSRSPARSISDAASRRRLPSTRNRWSSIGGRTPGRRSWSIGKAACSSQSVWRSRTFLQSECTPRRRFIKR
jgi:hypothetical protein